MGYIFKSLNCPERWRAFGFQGLNFILAPQDSALRKFVQNRPTAPQEAAHTALGAAVQAPKKAIQAQTHTCHQAQTQRQSVPDTSQRSQAHTSAAQSTSAAAPPIAPSVQPGMPFCLCSLHTQWPAPWDEYALKVKPGRALVWTYAELGQDLSGQGNAERSNLLKTLIAPLKLPPGSSNFWPYCSLANRNQAAEAELFLLGAKLLDPKFIIVFGESAFTNIFPGCEREEYSYSHVAGRILLLLPELGQHKQKNILDQSIAFLQNFTQALKKA